MFVKSTSKYTYDLYYKWLMQEYTRHPERFDKYNTLDGSEYDSDITYRFKNYKSFVNDCIGLEINPYLFISYLQDQGKLSEASLFNEALRLDWVMQAKAPEKQEECTQQDEIAREQCN
jgi:hypothetical protein